MKKLLLSLLFSSLLFNAYGQLKPHIGYNMPNLSAPPLGREFDAKGGMSIGVSYMMGNQFYFEPGLQYSNFGYDFYRTIDPSEYLNIKASSIKIPLMLGGHFMDREKEFNVRAFTGPSLTFIFAEDVENYEFELDERNNILWGWNIGYGVDYKMFFLEVKYQFGISNYFQDDQFDAREAKHNMFSVHVGVNLFK